ncbi:MAG: choice-of-anchor O protein [Anaerolineaceae bacterium]|nr:choice-of-anchor O protein [Anaerolineaceae bacterium]
MNYKKVLWSFLTVIMLLSMTVGAALAEDGEMFRKNVSKTPDQETDRANINHMAFYVPAQAADGTVGVPIEYYDVGGILVDTREYAKPLVSVYIDALPEEETKSGAGFGAHDAYSAHSLDDGATWKSTNLSLSADLSSFTLANGEPYPGDAHNMTFSIAGDKVLVGWISKYCDGGSPLYTFIDEDVVALQDAFFLPDLYVRDIWGVAGSQKSVDYELQGFPEVGEIPYSCVWSARGQLLEVDAEGVPTVDGGFYDIVWTKAERLTSGRRDANRLEMSGDTAAGFMMTWQEDPEGLRPGQGLGPGEGWSGAVVNQQTDLWYSFIAMDDFVMVQDETDTVDGAVDIAEYAGDTMPKVAVPMAMPIRLTDNAMCKIGGGTGDTSAGASLPYCFINFDDDNPYLTDLDLQITDWEADVITVSQSGDSTFCSTTFSWTNPGGTPLTLCQAEDLRVLGGRVGASRPRVNVQPYNSLFIEDDAEDTTWYDSAIVIMGAEESKALGEGSVEEEVEPEDIGKNMWYYSFDMLNPEFVLQGGMLNQPAVDHDTGLFFDLLEDDYDAIDYTFYETEISRRFSHMSQPIHQFGPSGISSVLIVKQGILNQGGPADIFLRLTKVPDDIVWVNCELDGDETTVEQCLPEGFNPYAYENLVCENLEDGTSGWEYLPATLGEFDYRTGLTETNPYYIEGLCVSNMINVSGTSIVTCDDGSSGQDCADKFPWPDSELSGYPKVTEWVQTGPDYGVTVDGTNIGNLDDQSWENPYDVAKGHRGYIDGDFIMMMYAWSPNWMANSVGNDHYNLYARRSFDGGKTWTTLPQDFLDTITTPEGVTVVADGTNTCENYKNGTTITTICTDYDQGDFEQARNLSQLIGNKVTILDPRYTPTGGLKMLPITDLKGIDPGYLDDVRDPSKYFIVYETGDNTTVAEGEAVPLDLFYSRATNWGDDYFLVEYANQSTGEVTMGFDWLEHDRDNLSGEAANTANNGGTYYYVIWNQWQEDEYENVSESDAIFRRLMFNTDDTTDAVPVATILSSDQEVFGVEEDQIITLIASARDLDTENDDILDPIQEYVWTINGVAVPEEFQDDFKDMGFDCFKDKQCNAPARVVSGHWDGSQFQQPGWSGQSNYQLGWYEFALQVRDNDDPAKWSKVVKVKKYIGQTQFDVPGFKIFLPLTTK